MPTPKLFTKQFSKENNGVTETYIFFKYYDDHNLNHEYQVYKQVMAKPVAREFGAPEQGPEGGDLNSRAMCDWVWDNIDSIE